MLLVFSLGLSVVVFIGFFYVFPCFRCLVFFVAVVNGAVYLRGFVTSTSS